MENLSNSENFITFEEKRHEFTPYGLTCERWKPQVMNKFDRHNEIEINLIPHGSISYFHQNKHMVIPQGRLSIFWGLIPHKITGWGNTRYYYVATIPLIIFLQWKLPVSFINDILSGKVLMDKETKYSKYDTFLFENWLGDIANKRTDIIVAEMQGRLMRLASNNSMSIADKSPIISTEISQIENMAVFIAQNYKQKLRTSDIGNHVGLNPDYANTIFRKSFGHTLYDHILLERITHAQQLLILSNDSILQIAYDSGFNSISRFNSAFRKINGCSPREYRKRNIELR